MVDGCARKMGGGRWTVDGQMDRCITTAMSTHKPFCLDYYVCVDAWGLCQVFPQKLHTHLLEVDAGLLPKRCQQPPTLAQGHTPRQPSSTSEA